MDEEQIRSYMTPKEAAAFLGISPERLRQLRQQGRVEGTKLNYNTTVYTVAQLRRADITKKKPGKKSTSNSTYHP